MGNNKIKKCEHPSWNWYKGSKIWQCGFCNETKTNRELEKFLAEKRRKK